MQRCYTISLNIRFCSNMSEFIKLNKGMNNPTVGKYVGGFNFDNCSRYNKGTFGTIEDVVRR